MTTRLATACLALAPLLASACTEKRVVPMAQATTVTAAAEAGALSLPGAAAPPATGLYQLTASSLEGEPQPLAQYAGKVALVVNVASECGFTPQYAGLQELYQTYAARGFVVLGFPSNDFGEQEPGDGKEIRAFCSSTFHVTFPMFAKVKTSGPEQSPVYAFVTRTQGAPQWNFHKYLVGKDGAVIASFPSAVTPTSDRLKQAIEAALAAR